MVEEVGRYLQERERDWEPHGAEESRERIHLLQIFLSLPPCLCLPPIMAVTGASPVIAEYHLHISKETNNAVWS